MTIWLLVCTAVYLAAKLIETMLVGNLGFGDAVLIAVDNLGWYSTFECFAVLNLIWLSKINYKPKVRIRNYELRKNQ